MERQESALAIQKEINQQSELYAINQMYLIHRIELHLKDSLEFEVVRMLLRDDVYQFLHAYTATIGASSRSSTAMAAPRIKIEQLVHILSIGCLVNEAILRGGKEFDYRKWAEEPEVKKLLASIPKHLMPFFLVIPNLLDGVYVESLLKHASTTELEAIANGENHDAAVYEWRAKCLEESVEFLKNSQALLLQKGVRD